MKMLQFIEIGTLATKFDYKDQNIELLIHAPVTHKSTMKDVYDYLADVKEIKDDPYAMVALEKFISAQDHDSFDKNIFKECEIEIKSYDKNQYYMIFHLSTIRNIMEEAVEKE
jgi:hypothetical protein